MVAEFIEDAEFAAKLASDFLGEPLADAAPVVGKGSVNKVFVVEAGTHKVVVRMSRRGEALDEYEKEAWCIENAAARGVPTPPVLAVGRRGGNAYMIESYVEGDEGRLSPVPKSDIWRELGRHAKVVHSIGVAGFGLKLCDIKGGDARASWLRYISYNVDSLTGDDPLISLGVITKAQAVEMRAVFTGLKGREFTFGLNHGDLSLKNTIVDRRGRVSLLDWGCAEAAIVPHHDLIEMLKMSMSEGDPDGEGIEAFLEGYGISRAEFERMTPELEGMLALRAFDKLRWALDQGGMELGEFVVHAREAAGVCLSRR